MVERKTWGYIEITLAIVLLVGAIIGGILVSHSVFAIVDNQGKMLKFYQAEINNNETNNINNFDLIGVSINISWGLVNAYIIIICSAIILGAIALLMFFDGINKLSLSKK